MDSLRAHIVVWKCVPNLTYSLSGPAILAGPDGEAILPIKDKEVWVDESGLNLALPRSTTMKIVALQPKGELFLYIGQRRMLAEVLEGCLHPTDHLELLMEEWTRVDQSRWFKKSRSSRHL